jgi:putative NADH-flavin reductase
MSLKTIAVIGASKGIGLSTVNIALERGWKVRSLSRNIKSLPKHENLTSIIGSALESEKVKETIQSATAIVLTIGHPMTWREVTVFSQATKLVIDTMLGWNPKAYLLVVTGVGTGDSEGHGGFAYDKIFKPLFLRKVYQDKDRQENIVKASKIDWTIVRPGFLTDGPLTTVYRCLGSLGDAKAGKISRADCADFLEREAEAKVWKGKSVLIG